VKQAKELLLPADTDQTDLVPLSGHLLKIDSDSTAFDLAAQLVFQQYNPFHNEPVALVPQKSFAPS